MNVIDTKKRIRDVFERLAETGIDINEAVYEHFLSRSTVAAEHMASVDERMRGRMLEQVMLLLMGDTEQQYLEFETRMHRSYGAEPGLYLKLFTAVKSAVKGALADDWGEADEVAFYETIQRLMCNIRVLENG